MAKKTLKQIREDRDISQKQLADKLGVTQGNISKIENQTDIKVPTLRRYIEALDGKLEIVADFPDSNVRVKI